ncbi:MAG: dockerin type I repeat-containing protein [Clostridia bacterium]|nr:dockerin type I repeat-containing protein [Clostridia bacterium]
MTEENSTDEKNKRGDVDGNTRVDLIDVLKLRRYIAYKKTGKNANTWNLSEDEFLRADINQSGEVDLMDILLLRRYIAASKSETIKQNHPGWYWED